MSPSRDTETTRPIGIEVTCPLNWAYKHCSPKRVAKNRLCGISMGFCAVWTMKACRANTGLAANLVNLVQELGLWDLHRFLHCLGHNRPVSEQARNVRDLSMNKKKNIVGEPRDCNLDNNVIRT